MGYEKKLYHGLDYSDVLIYPNPGIFLPKNITSRKEVSVERMFYFSDGKFREWVPIAAANMDTVGTAATARVLSDFGMITFLHKFIPLSEIESLLQDPEVMIDNLFFTFGVSDKDFDRALEISKLLYEKHNVNPTLVNICIDAANAKSEYFVARAKSIMSMFPSAILCVGNVADGQSARRLHEELNAEIVKIGLGSGACCRTRVKTGIGVPQFSAVQWTAEFLQSGISRNIQKKPYIIADGGITCPGDVAKAFAAGADIVMIGSLLAGHTENRVLDHNHKVIVRGMASREVFEEHYKTDDRPNYKAWEGIEVQISQKDASLRDTLFDILGGLRSACTYQGVESLEKFCQMDHCFIHCMNQYNRMFGA